MPDEPKAGKGVTARQVTLSGINYFIIPKADGDWKPLHGTGKARYEVRRGNPLTGEVVKVEGERGFALQWAIGSTPQILKYAGLRPSADN